MKFFEKTYEDFATKLGYHEYLKNGLFNRLKEKMSDLEFVKEYPPDETYGIDIVGFKESLAKKER